MYFNARWAIYILIKIDFTASSTVALKELFLLILSFNLNPTKKRTSLLEIDRAIVPATLLQPRKSHNATAFCCFYRTVIVNGYGFIK